MADPQLEKIDVDVLIISLILGTVAIPTYLAAVDDMTPNRIHSAMFLFAAGVLGSGVATFVRSNIKGRSLIRSFSRCAMVSLLFPGWWIYPISSRHDDTKPSGENHLTHCVDKSPHRPGPHHRLSAEKQQQSRTKCKIILHNLGRYLSCHWWCCFFL